MPGVPAAWAELSARFGRLPLTDTLAPAIRYAEEGYPMSPELGPELATRLVKTARNTTPAEFEAWFSTFAPEGGRRHGEVWRSPGHARTLQLIAETAGEAFYRGELAEAIDSSPRRVRRLPAASDLAASAPNGLPHPSPTGVSMCGNSPQRPRPGGPHGPGHPEGFEFDQRDTVETYHKQIEAIKLAFADGSPVHHRRPAHDGGRGRPPVGPIHCRTPQADRGCGPYP